MKCSNNLEIIVARETGSSFKSLLSFAKECNNSFHAFLKNFAMH